MEKEQVNKKLNVLLSSYQVFKNNLRNFHLNIKGSEFFEIHEKTNELYRNIDDKTDELAEHMLSSKLKPYLLLESFLKESIIKENENSSSFKEIAKEIIMSFEKLVELQKEIYKISISNELITTSFLMQKYMSEDKKHLWMLYSYLD